MAFTFTLENPDLDTPLRERLGNAATEIVNRVDGADLILADLGEHLRERVCEIHPSANLRTCAPPHRIGLQTGVARSSPGALQGKRLTGRSVS